MRSLLATVSAVTLCVALAACGSQLDPDTVALANGGSAAGGAGAVGGGDTGTDTAPDGSVPGSGSGGGSSTTGGDSGGTSGGSDAPSGTTQGTGDNSATGNTKAGSCNGFKNQTGITDKTITIANVSDISGPVPGIFESAQQATRAYAAYFNSTSDICGR